MKTYLFVLFSLTVVVNVRLTKLMIMYDRYVAKPLLVQRPLMVVSVNHGFWPMFLNWKSHANEVGIEDCDILVVAEDDDVYNRLANTGVIRHRTGGVQKSAAHVYDSKEYIKMVSKRPEYLIDVLKKHRDRNIIYTDVDTVLLRDIRELTGQTMAFGIDANNALGVENYYCTGIMFWPNEHQSMKVLETWNDEITAVNQLNQPLFNRVVRDRHLNANHTAFDKMLVMSGKTLTDNGGVIPKETYLVHANYIQGYDNKVKLFKKHGLWRDVRPKPVIAICTCVRSIPSDRYVEETYLLEYLLKTLEETVTDEEKRNYDVTVYVYYDDDDVFWKEKHKLVKSKSFKITFDSTKRSDRIPWNEVTKRAYDEGVEYIFRTNDDVQLRSKGWITMAVAKLRNLHNVGVVGPLTLKGNTNILTLDFTHRTHIDIFGTYYPPEMKNWYVDNFITFVYNNRLVVLKEWDALHLVKPTRYSIFTPKREIYESRMVEGRKLINDYLNEQNVPVVVGSPNDIPCAVRRDRLAYVDYWVECNNTDYDPCPNITHVLPTRENDFLMKTETRGGCDIMPWNVFRVKSSLQRHISLQLSY